MKPGILTSREAASSPEMTEEQSQDKIELKKGPVSPLCSDTMIGSGSAECANLILNKECTTSQPITGNTHRNQRKSKPFKLQRKESIISRSETLRLWSGNDESENMKTETTLNLLSRHCSPLYSIMFRHQAMKHFEAASDESGEEDEEEEEKEEKGCSIDDREESIGNQSSSLNRSAEALNSEQKSGYECGECELVADTRPSLKKHIAICHPLPEQDDILTQTSVVKISSTCPLPSCEFQTAERDEMEAHVATHVADGYSPTGKRRNGPISLQRVRYEREEYRCQICAYTCTIEKAFYKHLKLHSLGLGAASVKISCVICGKDRPSEVEMNKHMKKHREDRYFCCDICIFKTVQLKKLIQHRRMHTGEKPHLCPHCTYRSARRDNLRSHVRRVHKKDNLFCDTFSPRNLLLTPETENNEETSAFSALVELEES